MPLSIVREKPVPVIPHTWNS